MLRMNAITGYVRMRLVFHTLNKCGIASFEIVPLFTMGFYCEAASSIRVKVQVACGPTLVLQYEYLIREGKCYDIEGMWGTCYNAWQSSVVHPDMVPLY